MSFKKYALFLLIYAEKAINKTIVCSLLKKCLELLHLKLFFQTEIG